jgi:hypothetical protein
LAFTLSFGLSGKEEQQTTQRERERAEMPRRASGVIPYHDSNWQDMKGSVDVTKWREAVVVLRLMMFNVFKQFSIRYLWNDLSSISDCSFAK